MTGSYTSLSTTKQKDSRHSEAPGSLNKPNTGILAHISPRITRSWAIALIFIGTVTVILMLNCIQPNFLHPRMLCCSNGKFFSMRGSAYVAYDENNDGIMDRIRYKHTKRRLPQCLIIGVRKGGTRALLEFLNLHPRVQAEKREMHFFDHDDNYSMGVEWYRKRMPFSFPDQITIEKTPAYFVEERVPERVAKMNRTVKLIIILRDPTERAISDYMQIHSNRLERSKFHDSFEVLAIDPESGQVRKSYKAIRRSLYHRHMERWLRWFPLEQFHIVSGENLVKNPVEELVKVEKFLGLEHKISYDQFFLNTTRGFYCIHKETHEKCLARSKGRKHPDVDPIVLAKLRDFFRPHNQKLYNMVKRDFGWP